MDKRNMERAEIEAVYGKISPFELRKKLVSLAEGQVKNTRTLLNAGRGNPNWTAALPREAFFSFGQFAALECRRTQMGRDIAGVPHREGIAGRFREFLEKNADTPGAVLLSRILEYGAASRFDPDAWIYELVDGVIGDHYPMPGRMLCLCEAAVRDYITSALCRGNASAPLDLFAVEGGTAAMCYIFDSLFANGLLSRGDTIAVMSPIFTPYLEIPHLPRYGFRVLEVCASEKTADGAHTWQYPESELEKLGDASVKALFTVNPSNPPSVAMRRGSVEFLAQLVRERNPNLMVITDDVYCTFCDEYLSLLSALPYNTIGVYSFSKYFGVTGWRLGVIALQRENVFDKLLRALPDSDKQILAVRYGGISTRPEEIPFLERIVADSRHVALYHTAGLSTPQQVQMAFCAIYDLTDPGHGYRLQTRAICHKRQKLLYEGLGLKLPDGPLNAAYYTEFDLMEWACQNYGSPFADFLQKNYKPVDVLLRLAEKSSIVLLNGGGFHGPEWSVRISLANLEDESYLQIGKYLHAALEEYADAYSLQKK